MMRRQWNIAKALVLACSLLGAMVNTGYGQARAHQVTIGVFYLYPPFVYSPQIGFDINLMQQICTKEQLDCHFVSYALDEMLEDLKSNHGRLDAAISAISITPQRQHDYAFVGPYYRGTMSLLARDDASSVIDWQTMKYKTVGVLHNSTFYYYLKNLWGSDRNLTVYSTNEDMLQALADQDVDAIAMDSPVAEYWQNQSRCKLKMIGAAIKIPDDQGYGIVVRKNELALQNRLWQGFQAIQRDGEYKALVKSYFGERLVRCSYHDR